MSSPPHPVSAQPARRWPSGIEATDEFVACAALADAGANLFITGEAGTGKSTLLRALRGTGASSGRTVVLAPTGLAAVGVQGQTIHSFFGFPPQLIDPGALRKSYRTGAIAKVQRLIIDEISMVRADMMHGIDAALRLARGRPHEPFGGVQIIAVGDPHQLAPVTREREVAAYLDETYGGPFFFQGTSFRDGAFSLVELTRGFRQNDARFLAALNGIRIGDRASLRFFDARVMPFAACANPAAAIVLTPTQQAALATNTRQLDALPGRAARFAAAVTGRFEPSAYPADADLVLKVGAKVILLRNDGDRRWVNGTQAVVTRIAAGKVSVTVGQDEHELEPATWENIRYDYSEDKGRMVETVVGSFRQLPLRLAWALTIHKAQGMTLDHVYLDLDRGAFTHGQTYVALSRCRTLEGLALARAITPRDLICDRRALGYRAALAPA